MKLYQITDQYKQAFLTLADSELPDEVINDTLEGLEGEIEVKGLNVAAHFQNLEAESAAIKNAIELMTKRKKAIDNKVVRMKSYLLSHMQDCGITEISCPEFCVKVKKNPPSVVIYDEDALPPDYKKVKTTESWDKTAIKADIKSGLEIEGAKLEQGSSLKIT